MSIPNSINVNQEPIAGSTSDTANATHSAATITYAAAGAGKVNVISGLYWSFSGTPAAATNLQISDGSNVIFSIDITAAGAGFIPFNPPKKGTANTAMTITLADGGSGIVGRVNTNAWVEGPGP
jgi:hypothetical protein